MAEQQVICSKNIEIEGQIAFGQGSVIHPDCSIIAESAPIVCGEFNIIEERVRIINRKPEINPTPLPLQIGSYNLFEVGAIIEYCEIGNYNVFEHRCKIESNCKIGNGCIITAGVRVPSGTSIPDLTVVYGEGMMRKNQTMQEDSFRHQIKALTEVLAKCLGNQAIQTSHK